GLKLALVFEVFGGANDFVHDDIDAESGAKHGDFARQWAANVGAPANTIIWFAIDTDCSTSQYERLVKPYLAAAKVALRGQYRIGVYACGFVCGRVLDENLVDATWLTQSMGFNGSRAFRDSRRWRLLQGPETTFAGLSIDSDEANGDDYGAFVPFQAPALQPAVTSQTVPQPDAPAPPQIDLARIQQDIARLGQIAATFSQFANTLGQLPTAGLPPQIAAIEQTVTRLGQIAGTLSQFATALSAQSSSAAAPTAPVLSPIDKVLGGQAMVGLKTPLAIGAYALMWILQGANVVGTATGDKATTTGSVLTALIAAFGGLGVTAKFDRAFQAIGAMAPAIQKLAAIALMLPKI
ncbi:MAG: hypothetical protein QOI40_235, partial [Alphaproteobacteria bacterium]|nr:hypothetical protein [Alphaproteobacteria bacterium]